jgi:anti-anti-sigma factor
MGWDAVRQADDVVVLALAGRLDQLQHEALLQSITDAAGQLLSGGVVVLDCAAVGYISSIGLRALFNAFRTLRGTHSLVVADPSPLVREIFEISKMSNLLPLFDDQGAAVQGGRERLAEQRGG